MDKNLTDVLDQTYNLLDKILYSYELYKGLARYFEKTDKSVFDPYEVEFWSHISDNCIQMAAVQWYKVFGPYYHNESTHFTNLISEEELKCRLMEKGIDFSQVSHDMKTFRNKYVAHKDKKAFAVPYFFVPLRILHEFDSIVREKYEEVKKREYIPLVGLHEAYRLRIEDCLVKMRVLLGIDIEDSEFEF